MAHITVGFQAICFLDAYKGHNQIFIDKKYKMKKTFIIEQGTYCYRMMPFRRILSDEYGFGWLNYQEVLSCSTK